MGASAGVAAQLGWATSGTADTPVSFLSESLRKSGTNITDDGVRGTRSQASERIRAGNFTVAGSISMQPNPAELVDILKWCGLSASGTTYSLTETLTSRDVTIDRIAKVFTYAGVYVNRATFSSSEGSPLTVTLDLVGKTETVANSGTFPSLNHSLAAPFMHYDGTFSLVSSSRTPKSSVITIDNMLIAAFNNSQSAGFIIPGGRQVSAEFTLPYSSTETDLYAQAVAGSAATITYAVGGYSLAFALASLQCPDNSPVITNKNGEVVLQVAGIARASSTTKELIVTFDSTA
jgi:hypothetical protein